MMNTLIVESGATKANWVLLSGKLLVFKEKSPGLNPYFLTDEELLHQFYALRKNISLPVHAIYFYSTGCGAEDQKSRVAHLLNQVFQPLNSAVVDSDITAAAHSIGPCNNGLVGILGTGSNACLVHNGVIETMAGGFGFILGDEGSGAALGLSLLQAWLNKELPPDIQLLANRELKLNKDEIFQAVYKNPFPSRYLAGFATFFYNHSDLPWINQVVKYQFNLFVTRYFLTLVVKNQGYQAYLIGSVAFYFRSVMEAVLQENQLILGSIVQDPMDGLILFHTNN
jgi:N-acetylglucosamine kinase-like BadF-type ATPase